jgi:DNA invertase Pin-like site-specific DNA recombinase
MKVKTAYSYVRFSDKKQSKGDSLRRQLEWGRHLATAKGWALNESLKPDLGVSAFRGTNAARGHLAAFLEAVKQGRVKPGDVLLIEALDRLTREDIDPAWETFRSILKAGVEIVTREPERHYFPADLSNFGTRIEVQAYMLRAYNESATKSMRGKEYWHGVRAGLAEGKRKTKGPRPAWLRPAADRQSFELIPKAAEAVKLVYRLAGEGMGVIPIALRLNQSKVPPIGRSGRWTHSYVNKILHERAVLGEYTPCVFREGKRVPCGDTIPDRFPRLISDEEWYRVRQAVRGRGRQVGPRGERVANLFTGLIFDARDGSTLQLTKTNNPTNDRRVLIGYGCRNIGTERMAFPYDAVETAFLKTVRELKPADVLGGKADAREDEITALTGRVQDLDRRIAAVQRRALEEDGIDALMTLLGNLDRERKESTAKLDKLKAEAAHQQPTALTETQSLIDLMGSATGEELERLRTRVKARIKQIVSEMWMIVFDASSAIRAAEIQIVLHSGTVRGLVLSWLRRGGRKTGLVCGGASLLGRPGETTHLSDKLLSNYRTDPKTREWFTRHHDNLRPAICEAVQAAMQAGDVLATRGVVLGDGILDDGNLVEIPDECIQ